MSARITFISSNSCIIKHLILSTVLGRAFVKRFALCYRTVVLSVLSVPDVGVLWPNGSIDQNETWHGGRFRLRPGHIVLDGDRAPPKGAQPPIVGPCLLCQTAGRIKMPLRTKLGLGPCDIVLGGDSVLPPQKGGSSPATFRPMYCGRTAGWIKMPLGKEIGLGPGHIMLDGDLAPAKGAQPPIFVTCPLCSNGWMEQDATWYESRPHCVRWGPSSPLKKWHNHPNFRSMSLVAKRLDKPRCNLVWC